MGEQKRTKTSSDENIKIPINKTAIIQYDGKQFLVRIPKEIAQFYNIKRGHRFKFSIEPTGRGKGKNTFEITR